MQPLSELVKTPIHSFSICLECLQKEFVRKFRLVGGTLVDRRPAHDRARALERFFVDLTADLVSALVARKDCGQVIS